MDLAEESWGRGKHLGKITKKKKRRLVQLVQLASKTDAQWSKVVLQSPKTYLSICKSPQESTIHLNYAFDTSIIIRHVELTKL